MRQPSPPFNDADAVNYPESLPVFVPDQGDRQTMASTLADTAREHGLNRHVRADAARGGYWISDALADVVYDQDDENEEEAVPETPDEAPAKTGRSKK